jgi:hypothetical protein
VPSANPFVETFSVADTPGTSYAGGGGISIPGMGGGASDHHFTAGTVLVAIAVLILLFKSKFRFASTVG